MSNTRLSVAARNAANDACTARVNGGRLRIYSGTQPTNPDTALGAQVLLADLALSATAAAASSGGVSTFNTITSDSSADATGTASWFSLTNAAGTVREFDGDVGVGGGFNLQLATTSIVAGAIVSVTSLTYTTPMQGA
jgi:hypothetical protein